MKKTLCLLLAAIMMLAFAAGCSTSESGTASSPSPSGTESKKDNSGNQDSSENEDSNGGYVYTPIDWGDNPITEVGQYVMKFDMVEKTKKLPLTDERVTFTAWWPISAGFATKYDNYADYPNMIEMENRTNIHIEYVHPSSSELPPFPAYAEF